MSSLRDIVEKLGKSKNIKSTSVDSKFNQIKDLLNEIEGMMGPNTPVGRDEAPESISEQKEPTDINQKKGLAIAVLRKKNRGM